MEVEATGFQRLVLSGLTVRVTEVTNADTQLEVGAIGEEVTVIEESQPVKTASATLGGTLGPQVVTELPLNTRNPLQLLATDAGVAAVIGSSTIFVAGSRSTFNNYVLSGVDANNFEFNVLERTPIPNPDAVQEFRTQTSLYDATMGRGSGGNISLITRSGSSQIHGSVYAFNRSSALSANTFFLNRAGQKRPFLLRNHFGASVGGPFPGRKSLWFVNYEGSRQRNATTITGFLPVLPARRDAANLAAAFGLPVSAIDPVAVSLLNLPGPYDGVLIPSGTGTAPGRLGSFAFGATSQLDADQVSARLDHDWKIMGSDNHITANLFFSREDSSNPIGGSTGLGTGSKSHILHKSFSLSDTHIFNAHLINELTVGLTLGVRDVNNAVNEPKVTSIGMSRFNQDIYPGIPSFSFGDQLGGFGPATNVGARQHTSSGTLREMLSYTRDKHSLRFGSESRLYQFNYDQAFAARGSLSFGGGFATANFGRPAGVDNLSFRDFLIGAPLSFLVTSGTTDRAFRAHDIVAFIQDDFRISRKLTLNLGLRYDYLSNITEKRNRLGNFDPALVPPDALLMGGAGLLKGFISPAKLPGFGTPGVSDTTLFGEDKNNFAPRVGFAYDVLGGGKLAVRGGYGIYHIRLAGIPTLQLNSQPPFFQQSFQQGFLGLKILNNPFPQLPLPSQFPLLPRPPVLTGYSGSGAPVFDGPLLSVTAIERGLRAPYVQQWNLTTEYEFLPQWTVEVGYLGSRGIKLLNFQASNDALLRNSSNPGAFGLTTNSSANRDARAPVVGFSSISMITQSAQSSYHAALLTVSRRFSRGLYFKGAYTFSKSIDNNSAAFDFDIGAVNGNQFVPDLNKGLSDFDIRHRLIVTYVYNLPNPSAGLLKHVFGNWSVSGLTTYQSGFPFSITQSIGNTSLVGTSGRANLVPNCQLMTSGGASQRVDNYLNPACVQVTPLLAAGATFGPLSPQGGPGNETYTISPNGSGRLQGTSGRNILRGPSQNRWDLAAVKRVPVRAFGETSNVEFRAEFFNLFNHPIFSNPNGLAGSPTFGRITSTTGIARQIQFALKLNF